MKSVIQTTNPNNGERDSAQQRAQWICWKIKLATSPVYERVPEHNN